MKVLFTSASALVLSAALIGCQGANPFKMQANPTSKYTNLDKANQPVVPGAVPVITPDADNTQNVCYQVFSATVQNDRGSQLMTFTEDTVGTYQINVRSFLGNTFTVTSPDLPAGASFSVNPPVAGQNANEANYTLSWKPGKSPNGQMQIKTLSLLYASANSEQCGKNIREQLNLIVNKNDGAPAISFLSFPQTKITFGQSFKFQIQINDPASTKDSGPDLGRPEFEAWATTAENPKLDASGAIDCESHGTFVKDTTWQFNCSFSSSNIKAVDTLTNSGKTVSAVFFETAVSKRGGKVATATPAPYVDIEFPAQAADPAPAAPAAATADAAQPADPNAVVPAAPAKQTTIKTKKASKGAK